MPIRVEEKKKKKKEKLNHVVSGYKRQANWMECAVRLTFRHRMMNIALNNITNERRRCVSFYCMIYKISYHAAWSFLLYSFPAENIQRTSLTHLSCSSIFFSPPFAIYTVVSLVLVSKPTVPMLTKKKHM